MSTEPSLSNKLEVPSWYKQLLLPSVRDGKHHIFLLTGEVGVPNSDGAIAQGDATLPLEKFLEHALQSRPVLVIIDSQGKVRVTMTKEGQQDHQAREALKRLGPEPNLGRHAWDLKNLLEKGNRVALVLIEVDEALAMPRCSHGEAQLFWEYLGQIASSQAIRRNGGLVLLQSSQRNLPLTQHTTLAQMRGDLRNHIECIPVERPTFEERLRCFRLCLPREDESFCRQFALDSHGWPLDKLDQMLQTAQHSTKAASAREAIIHRLYSYEEGLAHTNFFAERPSTPTHAPTLIHGHPHVARYAQTVREHMKATTRYQPHLLRIVGTPGNGKALAAEAIACELGAQFVRLKPSALRDALDTIDRRVQLRDTLIALAPIVVFTGENVKPLQELFTGYKLSQPIVIVSGVSSLATVQSPHFMDGIDECLVLPAFSLEERADVIEAYCKQQQLPIPAEPTLREIAGLTEGYTYKEILLALQDRPWLLQPRDAWDSVTAAKRQLAPARTLQTDADMLTLYSLFHTKEPEHFPQLAHVLVRAIRERHEFTPKITAALKTLDDRLPR